VLSAAGAVSLLFAEGLAVGALIHSGVFLMGTHQNAVQGAVVLGVAVIGTLLHGALYALVGMAAHLRFLLFCNFRDSMLPAQKSILAKKGIAHWEESYGSA